MKKFFPFFIFLFLLGLALPFVYGQFPKAFIYVLVVLIISMLGSSVLDNVILVAAFIPVVEHFALLGINNFPLWWALLFGACYGGNITMVGSTANIVALGMLEKEEKYFINFRRWIGIGFITSIASVGVAYLMLLITYNFMP